MLHDAQRTSAPSACSVSISTAVWIVMCNEPAMRAPRSGCSGANSSRIAIRPGISVSAIAISLRPQSASARSATAKWAKLLVSLAAFIGHSIVGDRRGGRTGKRSQLVSPCASHGSTSAVLTWERPEPGSAVAGGCCNAPRGARRLYAVAIRLRRGRGHGAGGAGRGVRLRHCAARHRLLPEERIGKDRLALVEAFGVERLRQPEHLVVEVVAELVHECPQERAKRDDVLALRRAHPHGDA